MNARRRAKLWTELGIPADYVRRGLPVYAEARRLVSIGKAADDGRRLRLTPRAAAAWRRMQASAREDGVQLLPLSAYRSIARQTRIIRRKLDRSLSITAILRVNAAPGCSEHHTGRALDLGAPGCVALETVFARTREFRWLRRRAVEFGFLLSYPRGNSQGIGYEPWHWCWHSPRASRVAKNLLNPVS